jgi:hypothetical protein
VTEAAREATIAPGGFLRVSVNLQGYRGVEVSVANLGSGLCAFDGRAGEYVIEPGGQAIISPPDDLAELALELRSTAGTRVRIEPLAWTAAVLGVRKQVVRDPSTQLISSVLESPCWITREGRASGPGDAPPPVGFRPRGNEATPP